ncbi:hypothetical protein [Kineococcus arenarius]|uniref:hypothetical protein n=1 Tax=unclassified Kineococcus TaxID=2621656 RepID=UPI003D7DB991
MAHTDECYDGPVSVTHTDGSLVELPGPACPGQQLLIEDEVVELVELTSTG